MSLPTDLDDEPPLTLAPLDPETEAAHRRIRDTETPRARSLVGEVPPPRRWQFSLGQLLLANTILAVILALCQVLVPSLIAGAVGVVALAMLLFVTVCPPDRPHVYTVAWGLILMYMFVAVIALLLG